MSEPIYYMHGDHVRLPNGKHAIVEAARQTSGGAVMDRVEVRLNWHGQPWDQFETWHPSHLVPMCPACGDETMDVRRFDTDLLCMDCVHVELEHNQERLPFNDPADERMAALEGAWAEAIAPSLGIEVKK